VWFSNPSVAFWKQTELLVELAEKFTEIVYFVAAQLHCRRSDMGSLNS